MWGLPTMQLDMVMVAHDALCPISDGTHLSCCGIQPTPTRHWLMCGMTLTDTWKGYSGIRQDVKVLGSTLQG